MKTVFNRLPDEYKYFLNHFNGGKLFCNDVGGFEIFGIWQK
jgi:hypothetical protein